MAFAMISLTGRDLPRLAGLTGVGFAGGRSSGSLVRRRRIGLAGGAAILLWLAWPALAVAALAAPPFLLLAIAFAGGFLVFAARHRAGGRRFPDLFALSPGALAAGVLGMVGANLCGLLALGLVFPAGAVADPWPVLGAALRALVGQTSRGAASGVALAPVLALSGALCWIASSAARRRAGATDTIGGLYGAAAAICLMLHLCLEPRLPLAAGSLLAAAAIGFGPLGLAHLLWARDSRPVSSGRFSALPRPAAAGR